MLSRKNILILSMTIAFPTIALKGWANSLLSATVMESKVPQSGYTGDFLLYPTDPSGLGERVEKGAELFEGGVLNVPPSSSQRPYSASFAIFEGGSYIGPTIQTREDLKNGAVYHFPCEVRQGEMIIAWNGGGDNARNSRGCSNQENGGVLRIDRYPNNWLSADALSNPLQVVLSKFSSVLSLQNKQNIEEVDSEEVSDDVLVQPGEKHTLIRTVSRPYRAFIQYYLGRCTSEERDEGQGEWCQRSQVGSVDESEDHILQDRVSVQLESVTIEVLEGDISVSSEQEPEPVTVQQGETYTYPNDVRNGIDVDKEANSCEILRFLNYAYWRAPNVSQSAAEELAAHLKHHRDALGVAGRPPNNLSDLEQEIFDEMNRARNDPQAYAAKLKENQRFFTDNMLKIPEAVIDSRGKARAVNETVAFLQKQSPLPPLSISTGMSQANQDHVTHQGQNDMSFGHVGDNGLGTAARLRKYGTVGCVEYDEDQYENIVYFEASSSQDTPIAQAVVMEMLINSKPRRTGNSQNLFNPDYQVTGVACGTYGSSGEMCVVTYADGYLEKN